jgi:hypothetical protein
MPHKPSSSAKKAKPDSALLLENLRAMAARHEYPPPAQREARFFQRIDAMAEAVEEMFSHAGKDQQHRAREFYNRIGQEDGLAIMLCMFKSRERPDMLTEDSWLYNEYRRAFARFGGNRRFLPRTEQQDLSAQYGLESLERMTAPIPLRPNRRERELADLLVANAELREGIYPPETPPRPAVFTAPKAGEYPSPVQKILAWGIDLSDKELRSRSGNIHAWQLHEKDLARMVVDPGLLQEWPGLPAAWSPAYALRILELLRSSQAGINLAVLADSPDDWLSHRLPAVWAALGETYYQPLFAELQNTSYSLYRRMVLLAGTQEFYTLYPAQRAAISQGWLEILRSASAQHAEFNAHLAFMIDTFAIPQARPLIAKAIADGLIDEEIFSLDDLEH